MSGQIVRMSYDRYQQFSMKYFREKRTTYKYLRYGQAFLNEYYPHHSDIALYNEKDSKKAEQMILENYVNMEAK